MSNQQEQEKNSKTPSGKFKKGDPRINREGRPKGSRDFKTKFYEFLDKLAEEQDIDRGKLEDKMYETYYKKIVDGENTILKDVFNRVYGKPTQHVDTTTKGEKVKHSEVTVQIVNDDDDEN